jgi:hypothetical protein
LLNRSFGVRRIVVRHKTKSTRAAGFTIDDYFRFSHHAETFKTLSQALIRRVPAQAADEQFLGHDFFIPQLI